MVDVLLICNIYHIIYIYVCVAPIVECILYINIYIFIIHVCVINIYLRTISTCHPCVALKPTFCFWNRGTWKGWSAHTIAEYLSIPSLDKGLFELNNVEYIFSPMDNSPFGNTLREDVSLWVATEPK